MRIIARYLLLFVLLALMACASSKAKNCDNARCASCPTGQTPALTPTDCCKCVPVDTTVSDCSNVRCASCPQGQTPSLQPPDCCKCVPVP